MTRARGEEGRAIDNRVLRDEPKPTSITAPNNNHRHGYNHDCNHNRRHDETTNHDHNERTTPTRPEIPTAQRGLQPGPRRLRQLLLRRLRRVDTTTRRQRRQLSSTTTTTHQLTTPTTTGLRRLLTLPRYRHGRNNRKCPVRTEEVPSGSLTTNYEHRCLLPDPRPHFYCLDFHWSLHRAMIQAECTPL